MAQLAERCSPLMPRRLALGSSHRPSVELRSVAEDFLREMAFVYKAARSVRAAMADEAAGMESHQQGPVMEMVRY